MDPLSVGTGECSEWHAAQGISVDKWRMCILLTPETLQSVSPARTMVIHVKGDRVLPVAGGRLLAQIIPNAIYREVQGDDHFAWIMPNWRDTNDAVIEFCTGASLKRTSTRKFAAVLFTDIVDLTRQSSTLGDAKWRSLLEGHDRVTREIIDRHGGRLIKSTGDGLLVIFDAPFQGVACGIEMCDALSGMGVTIRAGLHVGQIEVHEDGDISGIAVNLAARVEQHAVAGELWTSSTVRDMMLGGADTFSDRGEHVLKGIDGSWRLYSVDKPALEYPSCYPPHVRLGSAKGRRFPDCPRLPPRSLFRSGLDETAARAA